MRPLQATARTQRPTVRERAPELRVYETFRQRAPSWRVVIAACRPRQWFKNVLVTIAPGAAGVLVRPGAIAEVTGAFVAFCLLSSATYLVNDVRDREHDRRHPRKRTRPVAAGTLSPRDALRIAGILAVLGVAIALAIAPALAGVAACYLTLTASYSLSLRRIVVADIVAVAGGFVLRAVAGGAATGVALSRPFLLVTAACAVFLVTGKRYAELGDRGGRQRAGRATLRRYSRTALRRLLVAAATLGCLAYALWAFGRADAGPWLELSVIPFAIWLGRYGLKLSAGAGEAPEELILGDPLLLVLGAAWAALFAGGVYGPA
jgi:decaprenyl-phosphate phosphoribosyltransferase